MNNSINQIKNNHVETLMQKRENYLLHQMSTQSDISTGGKPLQRYCIASTPRSGSTLISRMLLSSNLAGDPKEYLSPLLIQAWYKLNSRRTSISGYISELESRRTSQNGIFGIKIHGRHLDALSKKINAQEIHSILNKFDKFIFISRKDKINQSISYYMARSTGVFHSDQEEWLDEFDIPEPNFNAPKILFHLSEILNEEKIWQDVFNKIKKPVLSINYEDIASNYEHIAKEVFDFLGIDSIIIPPIPTKPMKKKSTLKFRNLLLDKIGLVNSEKFDI